jgi:hypothetical protein
MTGISWNVRLSATRLLQRGKELRWGSFECPTAIHFVAFAERSSEGHPLHPPCYREGCTPSGTAFDGVLETSAPGPPAKADESRCFPPMWTFALPLGNSRERELLHAARTFRRLCELLGPQVPYREHHLDQRNSFPKTPKAFPEPPVRTFTSIRLVRGLSPPSHRACPAHNEAAGAADATA